MGEAIEETRDREELAIEGLTCWAVEFEFHSLDDKEPSKFLLMEGREGEKIVLKQFNRE